jgi:hypothetical protein
MMNDLREGFRCRKGKGISNEKGDLNVKVGENARYSDENRTLGTYNLLSGIRELYFVHKPIVSYNLFNDVIHDVTVDSNIFLLPFLRKTRDHDLNGDSAQRVCGFTRLMLHIRSVLSVYVDLSIAINRCGVFGWQDSRIGFWRAGCYEFRLCDRQ